MQKFLTKNCQQKTTEIKSLTKNNLIDYFFRQCKSTKNLKIGMEFERLALNSVTYEQISYAGKNGVKELLEKFFQIYNCDKISENDNIIGIKNDKTTITLEPGAQIEISCEPQFCIKDIKNDVEDVENKLNFLAKELGIKFVEQGITPVSKVQDISLIPKHRYHLMANLLSGNKASLMMRATAGTQVAVDYVTENDCIRKLRASLMLSPFLTAVFANSPFYAGKNTGFKSYRATTWLDTDNARCGLVSENLFNKNFEKFNFEQYVNTLLKIPVLYFVRNGDYIVPGKSLTFGKFMNDGYDNYFPTMNDFLLHLNLYFPDVRLREYIEIRNHDSLPVEFKYAVGALYKGLLFSNNAVNYIFELFKDFEYSDFEYLRSNVPKCGLFTQIKKYIVWDFAKEIIELAIRSLKKNQDNDVIFLEQIQKLILDKKVPADVTAQRMENILQHSFC